MNRTPDLIAELRTEILKAGSEDLPSIRGQLITLGMEVEAQFARSLLTQRHVPPPAAIPEDDTLLTVDEAAKRLGQKPGWVRAHQNELPRVNLPGRTVRFSGKRLDAWMRRRTA